MMRLKKRAGFTVVETMMFLAVSGAIFVSVAIMISGQLDKYQSKDAVNQLESTVRGVLNDVTNGYYPITDTNPSCGGASYQRGSSQTCMFAGKSITFEANDILIQAYGVKIDRINPINNINQLLPLNLNETKPYQWGITPISPSSSVYYILNTNFATATNLAGNFLSGTQSVSLFYGSNLALVDSSNNKVCFKLNSHPFKSINFFINNIIRKPEFRNSIA